MIAKLFSLSCPILVKLLIRFRQEKLLSTPAEVAPRGDLPLGNTRQLFLGAP